MLKMLLGMMVVGAIGSGALIYNQSGQPNFIEVRTPWKPNVSASGKRTSAIVASDKYERVSLFVHCIWSAGISPEVSMDFSLGGKNKMSKSGWSPKQIASFKFANGRSHEAAYDRPGTPDMPQVRRSVSLDNRQSRLMLASLVASGYVDVTIDGKTARFYSHDKLDGLVTASQVCPRL